MTMEVLWQPVTSA